MQICQLALRNDPLLEWALGAGQLDGTELTGASGIRTIDAHGKPPQPRLTLEDKVIGR